MARLNKLPTRSYARLAPGMRLPIRRSAPPHRSPSTGFSHQIAGAGRPRHAAQGPPNLPWVVFRGPSATDTPVADRAAGTPDLGALKMPALPSGTERRRLKDSIRATGLRRGACAPAFRGEGQT